MHFIIRKGNHYSSLLRLQRLWIGYDVKALQFSSAFVTSPNYKFGNEDDDDINKLYGLCFGMGPHMFSYRIGWNSTSDKTVGYYQYYYVRGKRFMVPIGSYPSNLRIRWKIMPLRHLNQIQVVYVIGTKVNTFTTPFDFTGASKWTFKLFPYFGGNNVSMRDFNVNITEYSGNI